MLLYCTGIKALNKTSYLQWGKGDTWEPLFVQATGLFGLLIAACASLQAIGCLLVSLDSG